MVTSRRSQSGMRKPAKPCMMTCPAIEQIRHSSARREERPEGPDPGTRSDRWRRAATRHPGEQDLANFVTDAPARWPKRRCRCRPRRDQAASVLLRSAWSGSACRGDVFGDGRNKPAERRLRLCGNYRLLAAIFGPKAKRSARLGKITDRYKSTNSSVPLGRTGRSSVIREHSRSSRKPERESAIASSTRSTGSSGGDHTRLIAGKSRQHGGIDVQMLRDQCRWGMREPVGEADLLIDGGLEDRQELQVRGPGILDVVALAFLDVADVAGLEVGGPGARSGIEHRHAALALDPILPFVGLGMPMQLPHAARLHRFQP